ncbi:hypothetical protein IQ255_00425 [Pleurocapsales cyanobacterium LEGE 10410]|nr:hypothetical protein [Pleurocapsales cyanobacterium LEGE 10410]
MLFEESSIFNQQPEPCLTTVTGEEYQPARIYYQVFKKNAVLGRFKRLRCISLEQGNRWIWLYKEEAKEFKFTKSYRDIPKSERPVVLGYFTFRGDNELILDVCSFKLVVCAVAFFDQKINRRLARVNKFKIVNQLFPTTEDAEAISNHHSWYFDQRQAISSREKMAELEQMLQQSEGQEDRQEQILDLMERQMKQPLPEIEDLETSFYEDGIEFLQMALQMRLLEAKQHWQGNKNFSQFDIMETILEKTDY